MSVNPVFLDETGRRWKVVRLVLLTGATVLIAIPLGLLLSIQNVSVTPAKSLGQQEASLSRTIARPIDPASWSTRASRIARHADPRTVWHD
ncbi:MAG: hypothetical protein ACLPKB_03515 [Xanthobacteraceae bacterium]